MPKRTDVRITDIAREAGVSITTVSRILNHDRDLKISASTRERVIEAAQQLGYQPNLFAAALRSNRTGIIGALSPNLAGTFLPLLTHELQRTARQRGAELLIGSPMIDTEQMEGQLKKLQGLLFDGLLLLSDMLDYQATVRRLRVLRKPYISVGAGMNGLLPLVNVDEVQAGRLAVEHLHGLGHTHIAFLGSTWKHEQERAAYFVQAMHDYGLTVRAEYLHLMDHVRYVPYDPQFREMWTTAPLEGAQALLRLPEPPTAIVCANDGFAIAALKGALRLGLRVPADVSIIGQNDELPSTLFHPELTTVRQPLDEIAQQAIDLLLTMIESPLDESLHHQRVIVAPQFVFRETTARAP